MMIYQLPFSRLHLFNVFAQIAFDYIIVKYLSANTLAYLILSSFFAGSLHPCAGHFIAEHYVFDRGTHEARAKSHSAPLPETFSYYGPLNVLTYNVGLHNEHHDFPAIPWTRLPLLNSIANEFYADLPHHKSWTKVIWQFIWDPDVSLWCRVKREQVQRKNAAWKESELALS